MLISLCILPRAASSKQQAASSKQQAASRGRTEKYKYKIKER
jgi:hypothetical protein